MFRFTIRDVLWLMVVAGMGLGWWLEYRDSSMLRRERDEAVSDWRDASRRWVEATSIPIDKWGGYPKNGRVGGGAAALRANPQEPPPSADSDANVQLGQRRD